MRCCDCEYRYGCQEITPETVGFEICSRRERLGTFNRLTDRTVTGEPFVKPEFLKNSHALLIERLAAYEDTGLTPEDIQLRGENDV